VLALATGAAVLAASGIAAGATGNLNYEDCITGETESGPAGSAACDAIGSDAPSGVNSGLDVPAAAVLSADGVSAYVIAQGDDAIARFTRAP
jgi:hypothetical protein